MSKPFSVGAALVAAWLCGASVDAAQPLEEIVDQHFDVDADATLRVQNTDGSIRVYAAEAPVITVQAIKKAYNTERLRGIRVETKATPSSVAITTSFPPRKNAVSDRSGTVDYIIVVPQTARISQLELTNGEILVEGLRNGGNAKARLVNGWMIGRNCFGSLDFTVDTGRLDIVYDWWENHEFAIKALNHRGHVHAIFPSQASLNLSATATEGRVANGFGNKKTGPGDIVHSIAEVIGPNAQTSVALEARRGNIRIDKVLD